MQNKYLLFFFSNQVNDLIIVFSLSSKEFTAHSYIQIITFQDNYVIFLAISELSERSLRIVIVINNIY